MKHIDITKEILAMHENEKLKELVQQTIEESKHGITTQIQSELDLLLGQEAGRNSNVVTFNPRTTEPDNLYIETELLAAAGQSLGDWFSQPINFAGAGFTLDIRRVLGTDDEVDLYLTPTAPEVMSKSLDSFKGQHVKLTIANNGAAILSAELYIDETGSAAEGSGQLNDCDEKLGVQGKISIDIQVQE
jgi:hypothetical protein